MSSMNPLRRDFLILSAAMAAHGATRARSQAKLRQGDSLGDALKIAPLPNLRDLGGYKTAGGGTVIPGRIYRSNALTPLQNDDIDKLATLGLKHVFDLRNDFEIKSAPDQLPTGVRRTQLNVLADDAASAAADIPSMLSDAQKANQTMGGGKVEQYFVGSYASFVTLGSAKKSYRALYMGLMDTRNVPALFHCSSGKDRTGWAAAALLTLLGVSADDVYEDYLRSNDNISPDYRAAVKKFEASGGQPDISSAMVGVRTAYLESSFETMKEKFGTIETYFSKGLGIDASGQDTLRRKFTRKA